MRASRSETRGVRTGGVFVEAKAEQLAQLVDLVDDGELTVDVTERIPLSELPALHARAAQGAVHGKIIVIPDAD